jgi:hypothetical protein
VHLWNSSGSPGSRIPHLTPANRELVHSPVNWLEYLSGVIIFQAKSRFAVALVFFSDSIPAP